MALMLFSMSCKKDASNPGSPGNGNANANTIQGTIYDANGNKFNIANSSVLVHVWGPRGIGQSDIFYNINMDNNSHYKQEVLSSVYAFDARASMLLNGHRVNIPLDPVDGKTGNTQFASAPGVVRDFRLKLSGLLPGGDPGDANSYYGGKVSVCDGADNFTSTGYWDNLAAKYPGSTVIFTLTPKGPCVDGSAAPLKQITCTVDDLLNSGKYLVNFPLARYYLTALLRKSSGQQIPLKLTFIPGATGPLYDFLDLTFPPASNDPDRWPSIQYVAVWE